MGISNLIGWAVFGLIVGGIARLIWPGEQPVGCLITILLGVTGSIVGGMITHLLTGGGYQPANWIMSIIGAIVVLWIYGALTSRSRPG